MNSPASVCPVPAEQQPINEYQDLKESWFFRWASLDLPDYLKPMLVLWGLSWVVVGPVAAVSFPVSRFPLQFALSGAAGACIIPILALVRLYLGWVYIGDRLGRETIFYEESGWYDGQTWTKPPEVLQRDRLIVAYQIKPMLVRLRRTLGIIGLGLLLEAIAWGVLDRVKWGNLG
ncbi:MAG: CGLD27 family protein [Synechococcales bacterium]|nr:CGLD27 family protein [Synechococcales bacterium]